MTRLAAPTYGPFSTSRASWWTLAFVVCLQVTSYGIGLPELVRAQGRGERRSGGHRRVRLGHLDGPAARGPGVASPRRGFSGPRCCWSRGTWCAPASCATADSRAPWRATRVPVVGTWTDVAAPSEELETNAERPAVIVDSLTPEDATVGPDGVARRWPRPRPPGRPWSCSIGWPSWMRRSWRRPRCCTNVACASARCRSSPRSGRASFP